MGTDNIADVFVPQSDGDMLTEIKIAVSYTHLRAHETVLDLVCRLLLEKKKQIHQHTILNHNTRNIITTSIDLIYK